ncbi:hypothetical protein GRI62_04285 [Erythrobacter arachoides]|uniref:Uncharacterized protein n=1 Tax=Aurantiacibacter arachoides TaxID=1850444 RepID=A0A845A125_9SPHN|nr:hypothetical protein [Aurantiacibacter arachoides]MXO92826.1 hypothetical protein [Aurantiacibacter arachoides]GGD54188.1 hypothetical protein GCM10011411_12620 [Aurantiacibacter arachoides]
MKRLAILLAPAALVAPFLAGGLVAQDASPLRPGGQAAGQSVPTMGFEPAASAPFDVLGRAREPQWGNQVRIERRVVIRIGPAAPAARNAMMSELPRRQMRARYAEVEHGNCIEPGSVVGVQPTPDNRLLFYTDERQILAAALENGCSARAFYAGFYIERNQDGRLCVDRDRLQSRAGAGCQVAGFTRLVAAAD